MKLIVALIWILYFKEELLIKKVFYKFVPYNKIKLM